MHPIFCLAPVQPMLCSGASEHRLLCERAFVTSVHGVTSLEAVLEWCFLKCALKIHMADGFAVDDDDDDGDGDDDE